MFFFADAIFGTKDLQIPVMVAIVREPFKLGWQGGEVKQRHGFIRTAQLTVSSS
jgi:hypothetical protein